MTAPGLGLLDDGVVDQHFVRRRRHNRLISLVLEQPALLGVAIDEETATWVKPDRTFEVLGTGPGLRGSDLRLHVLRAGAVYDLGARLVRRNAPTP